MPWPCRSPAVLWLWKVSFRAAWAWHSMCESNMVAVCKSNRKGRVQILSDTAWPGHGKGTAWYVWIRFYGAIYWEVAVEQDWFRGQFRVSTHKIWQVKSNETPTWCNTVQVLFLQSHSTCFGRKRNLPNTHSVSALIRRYDDLPATITHVPAAAVLVLNTPDDGCLRPKHVEWLCRNKTCTVLHQVGLSFDSLIIISFNNTRPYRNNGKNALHISHDLFHFPLQHTSPHSPPAFFQVRSHECERCSHKNRWLAVKK